MEVDRSNVWAVIELASLMTQATGIPHTVWNHQKEKLYAFARPQDQKDFKEQENVVMVWGPRAGYLNN